MPLIALLAAAALAGVHLVGSRLPALDVVPRSWLLSAGSGVSVAYVFVHLLPEVAALEEHTGLAAAGWLVALAGLVAFYGLELAARRGTDPGDRHRDDVGWLHLASYTLYNGLVGYVLVERAHESTGALLIFALAMGLHFLVNDHGLRAQHGRLYHRTGRWLVVGGVLAGAAVGAAVAASAAVLGLLLAFLAGGVTMNVLKEELPEDQSSRWLPFTGAAAAYAALLLLA